MNMIERIVLRAIARLERAQLTFGLREAVMVSIVGIAIASAVAYRHAG
jgi:hypothetical protein